ncbi:MAG: restriction endonuclease subunit S [Anaerovoracaceae bacterium]|jgi:type I restriction enzyme S subunit
MSNLVTVKDVIERVNTKEDRFNTDRLYYVGGEHFQSGALTVDNRGIIKGSTIGPMFYYGFKANDFLLVSRNPHLRKAGLVSFDGICSEKTFVLRTKDESILIQKFLPFIFQNDRFWEYAIANKHGSTNFFINWSTLSDYSFELPSLEQQKKIAELLWAFDDTKKAYKDLIRKTDELVKSQFIEMFGDPIRNDRGWDYKKLPEIAEIILGSTPNTKKPRYWNGTLKWITPAELSDTSFYVYDTEKHITEAGVKGAGLKLCPAETVLFSTRAPIGKTAIAGVDMYCNQGFKNFRCGQQIRPVYLYYLLTLKRSYFESLGSGTTFKELS